MQKAPPCIVETMMDEIFQKHDQPGSKRGCIFLRSEHDRFIKKKIVMKNMLV